MKVQDLLDKVGEAEVGLWDMPRYKIIIQDSNRKTVNVENIKVDSEKETITIRLK
jgi:hypothetical protein